MPTSESASAFPLQLGQHLQVVPLHQLNQQQHVLQMLPRYQLSQQQVMLRHPLSQQLSSHLCTQLSQQLQVLQVLFSGTTQSPHDAVNL